MPRRIRSDGMLGGLYHITNRTSAGLQFRSELQADIHGQAEFSGPATALFANTGRGGTGYAASDRLALRAGYYYSQTPVPDNTLDPNIPDANYHAITAGVGYRFSTLDLNVAYVAGLFEKRSIDANTIDPNNLAVPTTLGAYSTTVHILAAGIGTKF